MISFESPFYEFAAILVLAAVLGKELKRRKYGGEIFIIARHPKDKELLSVYEPGHILLPNHMVATSFHNSYLKEGLNLSDER